MGTKGRVPKTGLTSKNIRAVADISGNLGQGNVNTEQTFLDPDITGAYIDPDYCAGETEESRLAILQGHPFQSGYFRNYGGEDVVPPDPELPEIYFSSIIGTPFNGGANIELIPQTPATLAYLVDNSSIIGISVPPKMAEVDKYTSAAIMDSKQLVDLVQSAMLRTGNDNALNDSLLGVQVGKDYSESEARFSYNVSVYYGDIPVEFTVKSPTTNLWTKVVALFIPKFKDATQSIEAIQSDAGLSGLFDYLWGSNSALAVKAQRAITNIGTNIGSTVMGALLQAGAAYMAMILLADAIWNFFLNPTVAADGIYQYKNMIDGMYTWNDIKKTKYQIGFGRIFDGVDNFISKPIAAIDDQNVYTIPANSIQFPSNDLQGRKKYANFKFFPKCTQYDLMTPPPIITFKIELEAISRCRLSETKPTAFVVSIAPDKYSVPVFDIITPSGRASVTRRDVCINDTLIFENARFVDFIAMLDLEPSSGGIGGLIKTYEDRYINSDGADLYFFNKYLPVSGNSVETLAGDVFIAYTQGVGPFELKIYASASTYDVKFMQEGQGNIIKNPTFRLEQQSADPSDPTYLLKKFWNYDSSWEIRDGAIYRDAMGNQVDGFWQSVPALREGVHESVGQYFFLEIDCVVSPGTHLDIELTNTFRGGLYRWYSSDPNSSHKSRERNLMEPTQYPEGTFGYNPEWPVGMALVSGSNPYSEKLRITSTGIYKVLLRTCKPSNKIFKVIPSEDFTGRVNYVSLQFMPTLAIDDGRGAVNALTEYNQPSLKLHWLDSIRIEKTITLVFNITVPTTVHVKFTPREDEVQYYTVVALWQPNETADTYTDLSYHEYDIVHTYLMPGIYTATITCRIPEANLNNLFETFTCNQVQLIRFWDATGLASGGTIDLSGSNIGIADRIPQLYYMITDSFTSPLISLDVSNTPISGDCNKLIVVSDHLYISHTRVSGDLTSLFHIAYVDASYSGITICSGVDIPTGTDGNKTIIWKNCGMNVDQLHNLIHAIDVSSLEDGYLDIQGDNPIITDQDALDTIAMLIDNRGWTILYNAVYVGYTLIVNNGIISIPTP